MKPTIVVLSLVLLSFAQQPNSSTADNFKGLRMCSEFQGQIGAEKLANCVQNLGGKSGVVLVTPDTPPGTLSSLSNTPNTTIIDLRQEYGGLTIWTDRRDPQDGSVAGLRVEVAPNPAPNLFPQIRANDSVGIFSGINSFGRSRIWAFNAVASVAAQQDARAEAVEIDLENFGPEESMFSEASHARNQKSGVEIVKGASPSRGTAALRVTTTTKTGEGWFRGIDIAGVTDVGLAIGTKSAVSGIAITPKVGISLGYGATEGEGEAAIRARQFGSDAFVAQRSTNSGTFYRAVDEGGKNLFFVDTNGGVHGAAYIGNEPSHAKHGTVQLTKDQLICWRNQQDNGDVCFGLARDNTIQLTKMPD